MDDEYAEEEFEASVEASTSTAGDATGAGAYADGAGGYVSEEEVRPPASAAVAEEEVPRQRSRALQDALAVDDDALLASDDGGSDAGASGGGSHSRTKRKNPDTATSKCASGRHLLDNSLWALVICATRIRALQIPMATRPASVQAQSRTSPPAIRELRVFATLDRQAMQSHGSEWKRESRPETSNPHKNLRERANRAGAGRASPGGRRTSPSPSALGRRSGFLDEASWRRDHGTLRWTFPKEKFRKLKATTPRVKVLVFGICENAVDATVKRLSEKSTHAHNESIVSFGWFFLDLRTPDLPEKWFKLQNSRFGGEILISSALMPFGQQPEQSIGISPSSTHNQFQPATSQHRPQQGQPAPGSVPIQVPIAVEDGEFLRLGVSKGADVFVISVFLQAALNLAEVVETTLGSQETALESYKGGFWLSYSLFEVIVRTDVFFNLDVSEFPPIRDSFRVMSCVDDLADFCSQQTLVVYLCTYNRVLGGVEIPFSDLLTGKLFAQGARANKQPVVGSQAVVEGNFSFPSTNGPFIDASLGIECVQTATHYSAVRAQDVTRSLHTPEPEQQQHPVSEARPEAPDSRPQSHHEIKCSEDPQEPAVSIRVTVDQIRLSTGSVSKFAGKEGISLELSVGDSTISAPVCFCGFLSDHALGYSDALQLALSNLPQSQINIRCFSTESQRHIGRAQAPMALSLNGALATPICIQVPIYAKVSELIGQCSLRLEAIRGDGADEKDEHSTRRLTQTLLGDGQELHVFRVFLQLMSLRGFKNAQEFAISYRNPFTGRGTVEMPAAQTVERGEVTLKHAFCVFELVESDEEFQQHMEAPVVVDFASRLVNGELEITGSAVLSLNFLFFSQEQFCCAATSCGLTFRSQAEGEAHFEQTHGSLDDEEAGGNDRVHLFKSCAIEIPVISAGDQLPRRIGTVGLVAYAEDMGAVSSDDALAAEKMFVPQSCDHETVMLYDNFTPSTVSAPSISIKARAETRASSVVETREDTPTSSSQRDATPSSVRRVDRLETIVNHSECEEEKARAITMLKKSFEREKQAWLYDQQQGEQLQWKRRFEAMEKARMGELEDEWARREEERSSLLRLTQAEYERLEKALRTSLVDLEARERRLAIAENALQREQQTQRDEAEQFRKRLQSDHTHSLSLASKASDAQEKRILLLEKQLSDAEKRARQVEGDFAEYRLQQRKVPESRLREEISALKGAILELEKQKMHQEQAKNVAEANVATLKLQLEKLAKLVQQEKKKNEVRVAEELEKLRVKYVAREEKYVLDGDREELRAIKKQLDELKGLSLRPPGGYDDVYAPQAQQHNQSSPLREHARDPPRHAQHHYTTHHERVTSGGSSSSHLSSRSNWTSQFLILGDEPELRQRFRVSPSDGSLPPDEQHHRCVKSRNGSSSVRSNSSSQHYEHEDDDEPVEDFDHDSEQDLENEAQLHNAADLELDRLERERKLLLTSGAYSEQSFLVRELTRRIEMTKARDVTYQSHDHFQL